MKIKHAGITCFMFSLAMAGASSVFAADSKTGDPEAGAGLAMVCQGCHGPGGNSLIPIMYPSLAERDAGELESLLKAYRDGDKAEPQMTPQAQGLTDQEIKDLAAYFASQKTQ